MTTQPVSRFLPLLIVPVLGLSSCGLGKKIVSELEFASETVDGVFYAGFDAKVNINGKDLPYVRLPVLDPKNPARTLGYVDVGGQDLSVRVDVAEATRRPVLNGSTLPNGRPIPVSLPDEVTPIAFPVGGSNTKVYLAVGQKNIMAGVALTLKATDDMGGVIGDLVKFPANIFFPFTISPEVKGSSGVFTGSHFGLGVFAVKSSTISTGLEGVGVVRTKDFSKPEHFLVKTQSTSTGKLMKIGNGLREIQELQLD